MPLTYGDVQMVPTARSCLTSQDTRNSTAYPGLGVGFSGPYGVGITACTWFEYALSVPVVSTAVTT
jgi:hypothetical protein